MKRLNRTNLKRELRPVGIMQFGEGNFLRAFVDWIIQKMNDAGVTDSNVVVVQPMPFGRVADLAEQDGLYTVCLEGVDGGQKVQSHEVVDVISEFVNPYEQYQNYLAYAHSEQLKVVVSNTTEAGIALDETDLDFSLCPKSFPGKLLALLKERYDFFGGNGHGLAIIPCELIDHNGDELKRVLNQLATLKGFDEKFIAWLNEENHFTSTLVDRIVPGYPKDSATEICQRIGFLDTSIVKGEVFHLWVLKKEPFVMKAFPADKVDLNVIYADDIVPYKQRKVKVLNGSHTAMVPVAYLCGLNTVGEAMADKDVCAFVHGLAETEVKPTIDLPQEEVQTFINGVYERFQNPFVKHMLMSIALNSTTKFVTRLLPTYNDYVAKFQTSPKHVLFALAALATFYRGKRGEETIALQDSAENLQFWANLWQNQDICVVAQKLLSAKEVWQQDLCTEQNLQLVAKYLGDIQSLGMRSALQKFLGE